MSILITGDTHHFEVERLSYRHSKGLTKQLTKDDYVIITGDFGLIWDEPGGIYYKSEQHWLNWLNEKPWTTLFVDGNHENHTRLSELETIEMFGADVGKVNDSVYHLRRGRVYEIDGKRILTMGGAASIDRDRRTEGEDWWPEELPSHEEYDKCTESVILNPKVDYIVTHTAPLSESNHLLLTSGKGLIDVDRSLERYLDYVKENVEFDKWFFGHYHIDMKFNDKYFALFRDIVNAEEA